MKSSIVATVALAGLATAAPSWDKWNKGGNWNKAPEVFEFTSTYNVIATPDQVIGTNGQPAPGQPGAIGYYNYGINSYLDTICYVCLPPTSLSLLSY